MRIACWILAACLIAPEVGAYCYPDDADCRARESLLEAEARAREAERRAEEAEERAEEAEERAAAARQQGKKCWDLGGVNCR